MKRTPLKRQSAKKRKELRETNGARAFYAAAKGVNLDVHEVPSGHGCRNLAVYDPDTWLALTREQHDLVQGEPKEKQVARKFVAVIEACNKCMFRQLDEEQILYWFWKLNEGGA